jgi:hypothetical protein
MITVTPELVKESIKKIPEMDNETLSHTYKCYITGNYIKDRKTLEPFLSAILKELRLRCKPIKDDVEKEEQQTEKEETDV